MDQPASSSSDACLLITTRVLRSDPVVERGTKTLRRPESA
jgi:hypothetical protein